MGKEAEKGDWIEWAGGECPVDPHTLVDVRFRGAVAGVREHFSDPAHDWLWEHSHKRGPMEDRRDDIIAYRVVQP